MINDLKFVKGQETAKRAIEIAVAGSHSILLCGPIGCGKTLLAECTLALAPSTDAVLIRDDIDLDWDNRQLRCDLDDRPPVVATATEMPADLAIVDRFPIVVTLNPLHAADLILPALAEDSTAVRTRIATAQKRQQPTGPDNKALALLREYAENCLMSARAYEHTMAVAATIAKLDGTDKVGRVHVAEALSYLGATHAPKPEEQ
jgi:predicted ATPase with chaperone activity